MYSLVLYNPPPPPGARSSNPAPSAIDGRGLPLHGLFKLSQSHAPHLKIGRSAQRIVNQGIPLAFTLIIPVDKSKNHPPCSNLRRSEVSSGSTEVLHWWWAVGYCEWAPSHTMLSRTRSQHVLNQGGSLFETGTDSPSEPMHGIGVMKSILGQHYWTSHSQE